MSDFFLSASLDATSMANVDRMLVFGDIFMPAITQAIDMSLDGIISAAQAYMWGTFINPTGPLEDAFEKIIEGTDGIVYNPMVYAWRRNDGFVGMVDSLGRVGTDAGIHYMEFALEVSAPFIETTFALKTELALISIGG
ncbi:MAG: hypothetical protein H0W02_10160 [Ktedonobacteraceae bacterium]|nr:hypothetical protein [Ktedonobacteraceae bacterium]